MNCLTCAKKVDGNLSYLCKKKWKVNCLTCAKKVDGNLSYLSKEGGR